MRRSLAILLSLCVNAAHAQSPSWLVPSLHAAARAEGGLTVYSSINEQEALPLWKMYEDATGIPVSFVRQSDVQLTARMAIELRAGKPTWDVLQTATVTRLPAAQRRAFAPPQAEEIGRAHV